VHGVGAVDVRNPPSFPYATLRATRIEKASADCVKEDGGYTKKWKAKDETYVDASVLILVEDGYRVSYLKDVNEYRWVLKVKDIKLSNFSYSSKFERSSQDYDSQISPLRKDIQVSASGWANDPAVIKKQDQVVQIYFDGKTGKAKRAYTSAEIGFLHHNKTRMTGRERKAGGPPYSYMDLKPTETVQEANHRFTITVVEDGVRTPEGGLAGRKTGKSVLATARIISAVREKG